MAPSSPNSTAAATPTVISSPPWPVAASTPDRKRDGLLSTLGRQEDVAVGALGRGSRFGVLDRPAENRVAAEYLAQLSIRAPSVAAPVTALSGGNQQKALLARLLLAR